MLNWTEFDSDGSIYSRGKNDYYVILVRGVPEGRPKDCIIELYITSKEMTISEIKYKVNYGQVKLLSRLVILGTLSSDRNVLEMVEEMKEIALSYEIKNRYGSINSSYTIG